MLFPYVLGFTYAFPQPRDFRPITPSLNVPLGIQRNWAESSPYFPIGVYTSPPQGCEIDQVNILQRHGARFPTSGASAGILSALGKIQSVANYTDPRLNFLQSFTYNLGTNDLVPFGAAQSFDAGQEAFQRYFHIANEHNLPFVRAASSMRVVVSAQNWTNGFSFASEHHLNPTLNVVISESVRVLFVITEVC